MVRVSHSNTRLLDESSYKESILREYSFVRSERAIYRVFGPSHPESRLLLLLRYFYSQGEWHKPGVYEAECMSGDILARYDVETMQIPQYGMTLGVLPSTSPILRLSSDPLAFSLPGISDVLTEIGGCQVGLTGSRLAGLQGPSSDLDIVLYGDDAWESGRRILDSHLCHSEPSDVVALSSGVQRLMQLSSGPVTRFQERNIYKGLLSLPHGRVKLDIHYGYSESEVPLEDLLIGKEMGEKRVRSLKVLDSERRSFFPGFLTCVDEGGMEVRLWIKDHLLGFMLSGDRLSVETSRVQFSKGEDLVGTRLISLKQGK